MDYIKSTTVYNGRRVKLNEVEYKLEDGRSMKREHVIVKSAVAVLPITEDGRFVFIEEQRTAIGNKKILEIPAGIIEDGEDPTETAIRELKEETGYVADSVKLVESYYTSCGITNEILYLCIAEGVHSRTSQELDDEEDINVIEMDKKEALKILEKGETLNGALLTALLYYKSYMEE